MVAEIIMRPKYNISARSHRDSGHCGDGGALQAKVSFSVKFIMHTVILRTTQCACRAGELTGRRRSFLSL